MVVGIYQHITSAKPLVCSWSEPEPIYCFKLLYNTLQCFFQIIQYLHLRVLAGSCSDPEDHFVFDELLMHHCISQIVPLKDRIKSNMVMRWCLL